VSLCSGVNFSEIADSGPEDIMSRLSMLSEVLASRSLPGSLDLISHLLETLNKVMQSVASPQADVTFVEQSLISAIENVGKFFAFSVPY
jgi:U3 small nucleolar RNA-associated protein 10